MERAKGLVFSRALSGVRESVTKREREENKCLRHPRVRVTMSFRYACVQNVTEQDKIREIGDRKRGTGKGDD